jgi:predicted transcriptional regulator
MNEELQTLLDSMVDSGHLELDRDGKYSMTAKGHEDFKRMNAMFNPEYERLPLQ